MASCGAAADGGAGAGDRMGGRPKEGAMGVARESGGEREKRWAESLGVKVTEVRRMGSGWVGLNGGVGGVLGGLWATRVEEGRGDSEGFWVIS